MIVLRNWWDGTFRLRALVFVLASIACVPLSPALGQGDKAPPRLGPSRVTATVLGLCLAADPAQASRQPGIERVSTEANQAVIEGRLTDTAQIVLSVGDRETGWSSHAVKAGRFRAVVQTSDQVPLDRGMRGSGLVFTVWRFTGDDEPSFLKTTFNIAVSEGGPVGSGEIVFRRNGRIANENGTYTFADIRQANGTLIPVSVGVCPAKVTTGKSATEIQRIIHRGGFPGETRVILSGERESVAEAIQREVSRKLTEAGASYSKLEVAVAENLDNAKVSFQGLRNFRYADGTITGNANGHFTLSLSPNGRWDGEFGGTRFTLEAPAWVVDPQRGEGARTKTFGPAIVQTPPDAAEVNELVQKLKAGAGENRKKAAMQLMELGKKAIPALGGLKELLHSPDSELRVVAACVLVKVDPKSDGLESVFREALGSREQKIRGYGVFGLMTMVPSEPQTIPVLVSTLGDEDAQTAEIASAALARMGKQAVGALIGGLDSNNNQRRQLAAKALGKIGKPAEDAVPDLIKLLQDREGRVCNEAAKALGSFAPEHKEALPHLLQTMKMYGSNYVATSAAQSLGKFGPQVLPVLRELLRDERSEARFAVKWALEAMGRQDVAEGTVLYVFPDGRLTVWLGGEGALKAGDLLHVQRPANDGSTLVAAVLVVRTTEGFTATCQVLQAAAPKDAPIRGGDVVSRGRGDAPGNPGGSRVTRPTMYYRGIDGERQDVPFPNVDESVIDPEISALVVERIAKTSGETQDLNRTNEIHQTIVAKGTNAVSTLIAMAQKAANTDPLVLGKSQDFGNELRCPVDMLVAIGDRRAIPLFSALMKFDTKPRRMFTSLARLLCHGTDKQIELDAKSQDPNLARVAQIILRYPEQYKYYKDLYRKK